MTKKTVRDIDLAGKTVLVRVDYNVPVADGVVGDTLRIKASFDTLNYLLQQNCKLVLISHLGEPDGKPDPKFSLAPVAKKAAELLGKPIEFVDDCVGQKARQAAKDLKPGQIVLLENVRFHAGEMSNDPEFAKQLALLGDVFVNDAFAVEHRQHASVVGVAKLLPAVAGLLLEKEVDTITQALEKPQHPLLAIIGGAKISSKIEVVDNLLSKVDVMLIGGAMANTFLAAQGYQIGKSLFESDQVKVAHQIIADAVDKGVELIIPVDVVVADKVDAKAEARTVELMGVGANDIITDIGPHTVERATKSIGLAGTIIWNGPVGITEIPAFSKGSIGLAEAVVDSKAFSLIGGGDTAAFVDAAGLHDKFDFVSTGGGASLELMAGKKLPGVEALLDK